VHGFCFYDNIAQNVKCQQVLVLALCLFSVSRRRREMYIGHASVCLSVCGCVCLSVCLSAASCPHYGMDLDVTWGNGRDCALLGGFAIGARVSLL